MTSKTTIGQRVRRRHMNETIRQRCRQSGIKRKIEVNGRWFTALHLWVKDIAGNRRLEITEKLTATFVLSGTAEIAIFRRSDRVCCSSPSGCLSFVAPQLQNEPHQALIDVHKPGRCCGPCWGSLRGGGLISPASRRLAYSSPRCARRVCAAVISAYQSTRPRLIQ